MSRITKICQLPWTPRGLILDPYAGSRCWWRGIQTDGKWPYATCSVIFVDRYFALPGTIIADAVRLPFANHTFNEVWADPPHWIRKSPLKRTCNFVNATATAWSRHATDRTYGYFGTYPTREALRTEWTAVAAELHRVTKPNANLTWKSIDGAKTAAQCCNVNDLLDCLTPYWDMIGIEVFPSCVSWSSAKVLWSRWRRVEVDDI